MAGDFGFEAAHYEISLCRAEGVLLPAVHAAAPETLIIGDDYSCRERIARAMGREPVHLSQVLCAAIHQTARAALDGIVSRLHEFADDYRVAACQ
jgi:hypothetical protein